MCGFKSHYLHQKSGPARDLWIEIQLDESLSGKVRSGPARDLWIEMLDEVENAIMANESGPARDLWIEMLSKL